MAKNAIYPGNQSLPLTAPYAVSSGGGALIGATVVIADADFASGAVGTFWLNGTYTVPKNTGAGTGGSQGSRTYWDDTTKKFTAVPTSNTRAGIFAATAGNNDTTCRVTIGVYS